MNQMGYEVDSNVFFDDAYNPTLLRMIDHVVNVEGPVRDEVLSRRIARAHGWVRTGSKIQDRVVRLAYQHYRSASEDVGVFFGHKMHPLMKLFGFDDLRMEAPVLWTRYRSRS